MDKIETVLKTIILFFFCLNSLSAQTKASLVLPDNSNALSIGDKVPDISFDNMVNGKTRKAKLSDFNGKLVLLDFWATSCGSCISAFPRLDSLQKEYRDKIQIILVGSGFSKKYESAEKIEAFFSKWKQRTKQKLDLPHDAGNIFANALFPHQTISHVAWIGADGTVKAITGSTEVTQKNIKAILNNEKIMLRFKKDVDYDWSIPLFINGNGGDGKNIMFHSVISSYTEGIGGTRVNTLPDKPGFVTGITSLNSSIPQLYQDAIPEIYPFASNRFILEHVKDPSRYFGDFASYEWIKGNLYCYELITSPVEQSVAQKWMKDDLDKYLGLSTIIDKRVVKCLVIKTTGDTTKAQTKGGISETNIEEKTSAARYIKNMPLNVLARRLNVLLSQPVIDETNFKSNVDIELPTDLSKIDILKQYLKEYGFSIEEGERELDMFIISETR